MEMPATTDLLCPNCQALRPLCVIASHQVRVCFSQYRLHIRNGNCATRNTNSNNSWRRRHRARFRRKLTSFLNARCRLVFPESGFCVCCGAGNHARQSCRPPQDWPHRPEVTPEMDDTAGAARRGQGGLVSHAVSYRRHLPGLALRPAFQFAITVMRLDSDSSAEELIRNLWPLAATAYPTR
jgi:hypothetical protein